MKRMLWFSFSLLLSASLMLAGCGKAAPLPEYEEDGGVKDSSNYDAPKTISSTEITAFHCDFSAMDITEEDSPLSGYVYQLNEKLENGSVKGSYHFHDYYDAQEDKAFEADASFMAALQRLVTEYDLAQHNGHSVSVAGLPDSFGANLQISYASGESICADDNQDCFLSLPAMEALEALFRAQVESAAKLP